MKRDNGYFVVYGRTVFPRYLNEKLRDSTDFDRFNDLINVGVLFFAFFNLLVLLSRGERRARFTRKSVTMTTLRR